MSEVLEEKPQQLDLQRYLDIARRRHLPFLACLFFGWLIIWGSSWFLQARYKSSTLILVQEPSMPKNYVLPNVNDDLQARMESIEQQILSRTRLLMTIDKLHLYSGGHRALSPDEKVALIRKDISIDLVRDQQNAAITAFRIAYSAPDPHVAQEVTSELTGLFIDENSRVQEQESENTTDFMKNQLASARASLADQDAKVRAFQAVHQGELPTQEATNLQILSGLQTQLQNEQDALNTAKQQRVYTQALIDQYNTVQGTAVHTATGAPSGLAGIDKQIDTLRSRLADLSTRYTDSYPEVQQVKQQIADAEKARAELVASLKRQASSDSHKASNTSPTVLDAGDSAPMLQYQSQLRANDAEIANREQAITNLKSRINEYQSKLSNEPAVAQQLADLTRGYDQSQQNYNELLKKESDSEMATSMERMQAGERFTMLDPPSLPAKPDFPNRLKMCAAGAGAGFGLGILMVVLLEFLDDRTHSDKEIEGLLPVSIISEVPEIVTPADLRGAKRKVRLGWAAAVFVFVTILAGSAFSFLHS
jgi:polysaccharide chain length determinant protein (PEP-CTERM system associated)